ncbi:ClpP/crotonase-like domain-containing protein [Entophlyctis helioformis]|nr:ClpP/crotonase-like domain-containing protein [Entophlyctis helioformis]
MSTAPVGVHARKVQSVRRFELDRPAALNALNLDMINTMTPQLQAWQDSDLCKVIVLDAAPGSRAFCAGGDVKNIVQTASTRQPDDVAQALKFFEEEYRLNHLIATLRKPFVSVMNGITMGGGVGLSVHGMFRVATENTMFAMPETSIGLFPDVGGSFFLPRLDGELGTFLGLTGHRLTGEEVFIAGIATHYIPAGRLPALYARLSELESDELDVVNAAIDEFSENVADAHGNHATDAQMRRAGDVTQDKFAKWSLGGEVGSAINRCFKFNTVEEIFAALEKEGTPWARKQLDVLSKASPTALKVTLAQLRKGATKHISDCFKMEYRMVRQFLSGHDFIEGVTAKLIDKPARSPVWSPAMTHITDISAGQIEKEYFGADGRELQLLNRLSYYDYPHRTLSGLPTDRDVRRVVFGDGRRGVQTKRPASRAEVLEWIWRSWGRYDTGVMGELNIPTKNTLDGGFGRGKVGLREKVAAVLERHTTETAGRLEWVD